MLVTRADTRYGGDFDERWQREHTCGACGAPLVERWNAVASSLEIVCGQDAAHQGFSRVKGIYELYRIDPSLVPIEFRHQIERKLRRRAK